MQQAATHPRRILWLNACFLTITPLIAVGASIAYAVLVGITWREILAGMTIWGLTGLGITAGYHRLFSHCGYKAHPSIRFLFACLGAAAVQNSAIAWCSDHRHHHAETDTDGDPYNATRGFFYSHMGWIFFEGSRGDAYSNVADLRRDPILAWQHRNYYSITACTNALLVGAAGLALGNWMGMILIAGLLRIVVVQHATFLINSAAHYVGTQPWSKETTSRDNWFLSLFTLGEGYHNYHHSFQADYRNGPRWHNWDPTKWLIWTLSKMGLATDLRRTPGDVILSTRFEESRRSYIALLETWGDRSREDWAALLQAKKAQLQDRGEQLMVNIKEEGAALRDQVLIAQAKVENSLKDLRGMRSALRERRGRAATNNPGELRGKVEQEIAHLRSSIREAQRAASDQIHGWERVAREYTDALRRAHNSTAPAPV